MKVAQTPDFLESVANHPRVLPAITCKGKTSIDLAPVWDDCIGLEFERGGFVFHRQDAGVYEVHTVFLPRTRDVDACAVEALAYMFANGATLILTQVAKDLPHVKRFAERHGFVRFGEGDWERESGPVGADYFELTDEVYQCHLSQSPQ